MLFRRIVMFTIATVILAVLFQAVAAYYQSKQFDHFLKNEVRRSVTRQSLRRGLLTKALQLSLPVNQENVHITTIGQVFRVDVDYKVPINLLVATRYLKFHSLSAGFLPPK